MRDEYTITEARHHLTSLPEQLSADPHAVKITRHGEPVLAIVPWELYDSIVETLEIMSDEEMTIALRQGIEEMKQGKTMSLEKVKKSLRK